MAVEKTLSVIILTFNVRDLTYQCLKSLYEAEEDIKRCGYSLEVIAPDSGSSDGSPSMIREKFPKVIVIECGDVGFARGNNAVRDYCHGQFVLILNPDTVIEKNTIPECLKYMDSHAEVGAMSCRIDLWNGGLDRDARRAFPTPWVAFTHFSGLDILFPKSKLFSRYWYGYIPDDRETEVDVLQGAFTLVRKEIMDGVGWYDTDYFLDGEDIDLCWKIKKLGYKIVYFPKVRIIHYKGASKGKKTSGAIAATVDPKIRRRSIDSGISAMKIFYKKHLESGYPRFISLLVYSGIEIIRLTRVINFELVKILRKRGEL